MTTLTQLPSTLALEIPVARLVLPRDHHASSLYRHVTSSLEVARYVSWRPHTCVDETRQLLDGFAIANDEGAERNWSIITSSNEAIAWCRVG